MKAQDRAALYERDRGVCGFCGLTVARDEFEADHVPPRGFALPHDRLRVSHRLCNRRAGWAVRRARCESTDTRGYALRLPPSLKAVLERLAKENHRSLNAEIVHRLEQSVKGRREP